MLLGDAIEKLHAASRNQLVTPDELDMAIMAHLRKRKDTYGATWWALKEHLAGHLADQYCQYGQILNTFCTERRHKLCKAFTLFCRSQIAYGKGLMQGRVLQHLHDMREFNTHLGHVLRPYPLSKTLQLKNHEEIFPNAVTVEMGNNYRDAHGATFRSGDVFLLEAPDDTPTIGRVWYLLVADVPTSIVVFATP